MRESVVITALLILIAACVLVVASRRPPGTPLIRPSFFVALLVVLALGVALALM